MITVSDIKKDLESIDLDAKIDFWLTNTVLVMLRRRAACTKVSLMIPEWIASDDLLEVLKSRGFQVNLNDIYPDNIEITNPLFMDE